MAVTTKDILNLLGQQRGRALSSKEILARLRLPRREQRQALRLLHLLVDEGRLQVTKNSRFTLSKKESLLTGTIVTHRDGYGFLTDIPGHSHDIFIPARAMRQAMDA